MATPEKGQAERKRKRRRFITICLCFFLFKAMLRKIKLKILFYYSSSCGCQNAMFFKSIPQMIPTTVHLNRNNTRIKLPGQCGTCRQKWWRTILGYFQIKTDKRVMLGDFEADPTNNISDLCPEERRASNGCAGPSSSHQASGRGPEPERGTDQPGKNGAGELAIK